jgi:hypothetical protein
VLAADRASNGVTLFTPSRKTLDHWVLQRVLRRAGVSRQAFGETDSLAWPQNTKVVVALGEDACDWLVGERQILRWRGRVVEHHSGVLVVPTFEPQMLLPRRWAAGQPPPLLGDHPGRFIGTVVLDLLKALAAARLREPFRREQGEYLIDPTPVQFDAWVERALAEATLLSTDIETAWKLKKQGDEEEIETIADGTILRISFAYGNRSVSVPWSGLFLRGIRRLLASLIDKLTWNGIAFDVPVLESNDTPVCGRIYDGMDAMHMWQSDIPKGLEWSTSFHTTLLPWKHLAAAEPGYYNAIDSLGALWEFNGIRRELERGGQWPVFEQLATELMVILGEAGNRGNLIDIAKQAELRERLTAKRDGLRAEIQALVPEALLPRKRYKGLPKELFLVDPDPDAFPMDAAGDIFSRETPEAPLRHFQPVLVKGKVKQCSACDTKHVTKTAHFKGGKKNPCVAAGATVSVIEDWVREWDELLPFNPASSDQLKAYMRHHGHPVGKNKKDADKETADTKHLEQLAKRYSKFLFYPKTIDEHKLAKTISTYLPEPDVQQLIHTLYVNSPSTWRLGSRNLNIQNWGKRAANPYAKEARDTIIAHPGYVFVQADSSSIEAVLVGLFMGDERYIELAKRSIHAWLCCKKLGWEFTPANVEVIKESHKGFYDQMKITNHMTNYGGTPKMLFELFRDLFGSVDKAQETQDFLFAALPQLGDWHKQIRDRAHKDGYLESPWKIRHYFWDVYSQKWDGGVKFGKDAKRCIAFLPQHSAGMFMRQTLWLVGQTQWRQYLPANCSVHDSVCLEVPEAMAQAAIEFLGRLMTREVPELQGLRIGCEIEMGTNWGKGMKKVKTITTLEEEFAQAA